MTLNSPLRIGIVATEVSGDSLGSMLIKAIKDICPDAIFTGIAGPKMLEQGCNTLVSLESLCVMGFWEVLAKLPTVLKARSQVLNYFLENPPDVYIGIDAPDFNLGIAKKLKRNGVATVQYNSPTIWAWRQGRIKTIKAATDIVLTLFPFETAIYEEHQHPARFIGHPLADEIPLDCDQVTAREQLGLATNGKIIALLPGSRESEIKYMGKLFVETAKWCFQQDKSLSFIIPMVNESLYNQLAEIIKVSAADLPIKMVLGNSRLAMIAADAVLVKSGTATLEALLVKRPMVVAYVASNFSYQIAKRLVKIKEISLPNLLSKQKLVPELIQAQATPEHLGKYLLEIFNNPAEIEDLKTKFRLIHLGLRRNASEQAAKAVMSLITHYRNGNKALEI